MLSFGTAGCNLACKFCQNWDISQVPGDRHARRRRRPGGARAGGRGERARSVAFTYNDPTIFLEYAIDVADACRERGIRSIAVTAGYICPEPRRELYGHIDAANVDLKAFTDDFYHRVCAARLAPVLDTLEYLVHETNVWVEITTLLIPGRNDSDAEIDAETRWIAEHLGPDVPLHFTAFHPDYKMRDVPADAAGDADAGPGGSRSATACATSTPATSTTRRAAPPTARPAATAVVVRDWYAIRRYRLTDDGRCGSCGDRPWPVSTVDRAAAGDARRLPVSLSRR